MKLKDMPELRESDITETFSRIKYVSLNAEEPLTGLTLYEIEIMLDETEFSKKDYYNRTVRLIVLLHCLGYTDNEITLGLKKIVKKPISYEAVRKIRQRAIKKLNNKYGKNIGLITLLYETFREKPDFVP